MSRVLTRKHLERTLQCKMRPPRAKESLTVGHWWSSVLWLHPMLTLMPAAPTDFMFSINFFWCLAVHWSRIQLSFIISLVNDSRAIEHQTKSRPWFIKKEEKTHNLDQENGNTYNLTNIGVNCEGESVIFKEPRSNWKWCVCPQKRDFAFVRLELLFSWPFQEYACRCLNFSIRIMLSLVCLIPQFSLYTKHFPTTKLSVVTESYGLQSLLVRSSRCGGRT